MEYLYILSNESMNGLLKIGCTKNSVTKRSKELFTTGVPDNFHIEAIFPTSASKEFEEEAFRTLAPYRNKHRREFFKIGVRQAIDLLLPLYDERFRPEEGGATGSDAIESEVLSKDEEAAIFLLANRHPGWTPIYEIRGRVAKSDLEADYVVRDLANRGFLKLKRGMMNTEVVQLDHGGLAYLKARDMLAPTKLREWELGLPASRSTRSSDISNRLEFL